jgi:hypothetical protein
LSTRRGERRIVEPTLGLGRREACGNEQAVALARRDSKVIGEAQQHAPARPRPAGLDEAEVPRRYLGVEREIELAQAAAAAPGADLLADGEWLGCHDAIPKAAAGAIPLPAT